MADLGRILATMQRQIAELQRKNSNIVRAGRVVEVDPANQRVIVDIGDEANPLLTPWIRWPERGGARKTWNPPAVGEEMTVFSPSGEISSRSRAFPGGFTDENPAPSGDGEAAVFTFGDVTITAIAGGVNATVGGVSLDLTGAGLAITGGRVTHNGTDIGDSHKHSGIQPGPAETGTPV
ncbi:phage baseplate assembly protein V [Halocynthiibacter styelae]|uniref:Phage baseplate assembly protein V n=1 Tax=Halocynthiibacter styelae TaxID=2761955 RepID=A0A8J7LQP8_9RHOB|nr:phage baseplate assembly protein V [Paenihalocynthiibacter styelae]MBI1495401.1 phage baseplate assembly protein V [Paenihalocynthiibacter styelae]